MYAPESLDGFRIVEGRRFVCHRPPMGVLGGNGRKRGDGTAGLVPSLPKYSCPDKVLPWGSMEPNGPREGFILKILSDLRHGRNSYLGLDNAEMWQNAKATVIYRERPT